MAIALALLSSLFISGTTIIMKKGIERTNPTSAMLIVTLVGTLVLFAVSLPTLQFAQFKSRAFYFFVMAGLLAPAMVRWLFFISLDRIGPSLSSSLISTGPAFSAIIAAIWLKEKLTIGISLGIILIVAGIFYFEKDINAGQKFVTRKKTDLAFGLLAAFLMGFAVVLRKMGLNILNEPLFGVTVGFATSLVLYSLLCVIFKSMRNALALKKNDLLYLIGAGVFLTGSWLTMFYALSLGDVIIVTPIASIHPVMVVGLSFLIFRNQGLEKITLKSVYGIFLVLAGVLFITLR